MAFAQGSRSVLRYIAESSFGVTPGTPTMVAVPYKTHSLALTKDTLEGADIRGDRMQHILRHGNKQAGGSIEVDLRQGDFDAFLESAFFSAFDSSDEMSIGTTLKSFTIEDAALDIAQYRLFTGMAVNSFRLSVAPNQMAQATFDFVGAGATQSGSTAASSVTAASNNEPFDSYTAGLYEGGVGTSDLLGVVTSIEMTLENSLAPTFVIGSGVTPQLEYGRGKVSGTMSVYYENAALINKFLNETESEIEINVASPGGADTYTFWMPRVKYTGANVPVANEQSRMIELPFQAIYDSSATTSLKVTRT